MSIRIHRIVFALLTLTLLWGLPQLSAAQQDASPKQTLVINYPDTIKIDGPDGSSVPYRGIIYVKIFPVGAELIRKYGAGPIASAELLARQRDMRQLPLGEYEVHFSMRTGTELKTYILRDVILRADRANALTVEMNGGAKTTIIGGDMTAQQMADSIRQLQADLTALTQQIAVLKQEVSEMKRK